MAQPSALRFAVHDTPPRGQGKYNEYSENFDAVRNYLFDSLHRLREHAEEGAGDFSGEKSCSAGVSGAGGSPPLCT